MSYKRYEKIYYLLQVLYKYYPIGVEMMTNDMYPGFEELERISKEKDSLFSKNKLEPWNSLIQELKTHSKFKVLINAQNKAPFLDGYLLLKEEDEEKLRFYFQFSLLGSYYTCFYKHYRHPKKTEEILPYNLGRLVYKNHEYLLNKEPNIDIDIDNIIKKFYPNIEFFEHDFLMNYNIKQATPYTTPKNTLIKEDKTPIYDFFFSKYYRVNTLILE